MPTPKPQLRRLIVKSTPSGVGVYEPNGLSADREYTFRQAHDTFAWECGHNVTGFEIDFVHSPFRSLDTKIIGIAGEPPNPETIDDQRQGDQDYTYTVSLNGHADLKCDPHIIVQDDHGTDGDQLESSQVIGASDLTNLTEAILKAVCEALQPYQQVEGKDSGKRFFFPFGIQSIAVDVKLVPLEVNVTVAGTTSS